MLQRQPPQRHASLLGIAAAPITKSLELLNKGVNIATRGIRDRLMGLLEEHAEHLERLYNISPDEVDAITQVFSAYREVAARCRAALQDLLYPYQDPANRNSSAAVSLVAGLAFVAGSAAITSAVTQPGPQPDSYSGMVHDYEDTSPLPNPTDNIDDIVLSLNSFKRLHDFAKNTITITDVSFPVEFFSTFAMTPAELQKEKWECCCNGAAHFYGHVLHTHGVPSRLVSLRPEGLKTFTTAWHQVLYVDHGSFITVFDNLHEPRRYRSLEDFRLMNHHRMEVFMDSQWLYGEGTSPGRLVRIAHGAMMPRQIYPLPPLPPHVVVADAE